MLNKKAIFFTFIAILLLSALIFSFSIYSRYRLRTRALVIETRVHTMNSFMGDIDKDIRRGCFISAHRSILSMAEYISANGAFIDDVSSRFEEVFLNGTINGETQALMSDTTFNDWIAKMKSQGNKINLVLNFTVNSLEINQSDPWGIDVYLSTDLHARDATGIASWNVTKDVKATVPVEGFEDPVYAVYTFGKLLNTINQTPYTDFVTGNDTTNLQLHNNNQYYLAWSTAPSFLMRLEGNLSASPYGIESLINLQKLINQGEEVEERSVVDHIYWSNKSATSYHIDSMPSWFMMDNEYNADENKTHLQLYEVGGLIS